jgi:hypothetical protein
MLRVDRWTIAWKRRVPTEDHSKLIRACKNARRLMRRVNSMSMIISFSCLPGSPRISMGTICEELV